MRTAFKFRLRPSKQQITALDTMLWLHRQLYNAALQHRRDAYRTRRVNITFAAQSAELPAIRREISGMDDMNATSCQQTLKRLDRAFQAFFRRVKAGEKPGYPRFKGRGQFNTVTFTVGNGAKFTGHSVRIQGVGDIRTIQHRPFNGVIKQISIKREADGWYVILACDVQDVVVAPSALPPVGIDVGLKAFITTSDGQAVDAPKLFRAAEARMRRAQRALSRCKRGSNRRKKARQRVAKIHQQISRQRNDFHYKTIAGMLRQYGGFAVEDLTIRNMVHGTFAKSIHDAAWGSFVEKLERKAECAGAPVITVDPRYTSQVCSQCGTLPDRALTLSDRVYSCVACGLVLDRDENAARNILTKSGLLEAVGRQRESLDCALSEKLPALAGSS